ncbi:hypothetical protein KEM48_011206 [Puccinia striiformis f. sp. tritici PST-130]|nr:hypothetical protein KEM48_011206 [Puccinia striiformis f. sp. tritici PST-130]
MVKIQNKDRDLGFDGTNVEVFLHWYQKAAKEVGASEDDMAEQLGCFVLGDNLLSIVETFEGYEPPNWPKLKTSMLAYWGRVKIPRFSQPFDNSKATCSVSDSDEENTCPMISPKPVSSQSSVCFESDISNDRLNTIDGGLCKIDYLRVSDIVEYESPVTAQPVVEGRKTSLFRCRAQTEFLDEEEMNAELEPSNRSIEDPGEAAVSLLPPMPLPIQGSLYQSEFCLENDVENDHLKASDSGLYDFPYLKLPDIAAFEFLIMEPLVKEEKTTLVSLHQVKKNWEDSTVSFGHLVNAVEHNPIPSAPTTLQIDSLPEGLGEDHNYFIDRFHPSDHIFDTKPSIFDMTSTPDQVTGVFSDSHLSSAQNSDLEEGLCITRISNMISLPLSHRALQSNLIPSSGKPLRDENQLPSFAFEEQDTSFSDNSTVFKCENNQDPLFQDSLQGSLRDEDKLSLFQLKNTEGSTCEEKMLYLLRWKEDEDSFQGPVSPFQDQLRNEDKLYEKFGCMEEAKWRNWGTKVSPPNCASPRFDTSFCVKALSRATYVSKTLSSSLLVRSVPPNQLPALSLDGKEDTFQESPHSKNCKLLFSIAHLVSEGVDARQHSFSCILLLTQNQILQEQLLITEDIEAILNFLDLIPSDVSRDHILAFLSLDKDASDSPSFLAPSGGAVLVFLDSRAPLDAPAFSVIGSLQILSRSLSLWEAERLQRGCSAPEVHRASSFESNRSDQSYCARYWNEDLKNFNTPIFPSALGSWQSSASSPVALHSFPLLSRNSLVALHITSLFESRKNLKNIRINDRTTTSSAPSFTDSPIIFREVISTSIPETTSEDRDVNLFTKEYKSSAHDDFEKDLSFARKRTGVGPNFLLAFKDILRNEGKLQSFQLENLAFISYTGFNSTSVKLKENLVSWKISAEFHNGDSVGDGSGSEIDADEFDDINFHMHKIYKAHPVNVLYDRINPVYLHPGDPQRYILLTLAAVQVWAADLMARKDGVSEHCPPRSLKYLTVSSAKKQRIDGTAVERNERLEGVAHPPNDPTLPAYLDYLGIPNRDHVLDVLESNGFTSHRPSATPG